MAAESDDFFGNVAAVGEQGDFAEQVGGLDRDVQLREGLLDTLRQSRLIRLHDLRRALGDGVEEFEDLSAVVRQIGGEGDYVRLVIQEQIEEIASQDPVLGPTTSKRSAKTTVVAKDQETVVIGGIMQDRLVESVSKTPILGDIPLLGNLFRQQTRKKVKTNLLLFLTPYIIRESSDFRRIFERKMRERQEFVEQFYGATSAYDVAIDFQRKSGPLARMGQIINKEMNRLENGGPGEPGQKLIVPAAPNTGGASSPAVISAGGTDVRSPHTRTSSSG